MNEAKEDRIKALLDREVDITVVAETGSTNDDLKAAAKAGATVPLVLIAERQLGGRGREGRRFFSEHGLYMSILLPWQDDLAPFLTHVAAVAVARAIRALVKVTPMVKWVNDVYVAGRKVCGILTESVVTPFGRRIVLGIGVNVDAPESSFPEQLRSIAGSVSCDKSALAAAILKELFSLCERFSLAALREEYSALSFPAGTRLTVITGEKERTATARGLSNALGLIVEYDDGSFETLISGEVRIKLGL